MVRFKPARTPFSCLRYPPDKPVITFTPNKQPNILFIGKTLVAECQATLEIRAKITWAIVVDKVLTVLSSIDPGVRVKILPQPDGLWLSQLFLETKDKPLPRKDIQLLCFTRDSNAASCEKDNYWCQNTTIKIREGVRTPYLRISYHREPNIAYHYETLEARCTTDRNEHVIWLRMQQTYGGWDITVIQDNFNTLTQHDDLTFEITH
ncbi:hypothetical protein ElyMa_001185200, partial [Elysia marginata]